MNWVFERDGQEKQSKGGALKVNLGEARQTSKASEERPVLLSCGCGGGREEHTENRKPCTTH